MNFPVFGKFAAKALKAQMFSGGSERRIKPDGERYDRIALNSCGERGPLHESHAAGIPGAYC
jgi:hypothetical protein